MPTPDANGIVHMTTEEFHASFTALELLTRADDALEFLTSAHLRIEVELAGAGSEIFSVTDFKIDSDTIYIAQQTFGISTEVLQRGGQLCVRQAGGEWEAQDPGFAPLLGTPDTFLDDVLDFSYTDLVRLPDAATADGQMAYVIEAHVGTPVGFGELSPDDASVTLEDGRVQIVLQRATTYLLSLRMEGRITIQGTELDQTILITMERHNLPARFPEDLPATCSTLTS